MRTARPFLAAAVLCALVAGSPAIAADAGETDPMTEVVISKPLPKEERKTKTAADAALRGCVSGAAAATVGVWVVAILLGPFSGGASLALPFGAKPLIGGAVAGCIMNGTGEAVAHVATGEK